MSGPAQIFGSGACHRLAGVVEAVEHRLHGGEAAAALVLAPDHGPGGDGAVAAVEHLGDGGGVVVPAGEAVDVGLAELPLLQRVALALEELAQLLGAADGEPELDEDDAVLHQHVLELGELGEEAGALRGRAPAEDVLDDGAVVPGAVEEHHLARGRQVRDVALEVPLAALDVGGGGEGDAAGGALD